MQNIKDISANYKLLIMFAIIGFIFSFLIGLISSVGVFSTLIRSFLMGLMFLVVGFVILLVLSIFVPEVYNIITRHGGPGSIDSDEADIGLEQNEDFPEMDSNEGSLNDTVANNRDNHSGSDFKEVNVDNLSGLRSSDSQLNTTLSAAEEGKLGKHIVVNKYDLEYEPKLMAQAVRTMLSKDVQ